MECSKIDVETRVLRVFTREVSVPGLDSTLRDARFRERPSEPTPVLRLRRCCRIREVDDPSEGVEMCVLSSFANVS